jgi:hypothetical protein
LELFLKLGLVVAGVGIIWSVLRPRCAFVVRIKHGVPRIAKGAVTKAFLQEIGDTCNRHSVRQGVVRGLLKGRRIALGFSRGISPSCQQQLRNLWALSGWTAGPSAKR